MTPNDIKKYMCRVCPFIGQTHCNITGKCDIKEVIDIAYNEGKSAGINSTLETKTFSVDINNLGLRTLLENYPDNALISIECCNPKKLTFDKENNLIRID